MSKVDLLSGIDRRAAGVSYRCNITEGSGKGTCVEEVVEVTPMESFVTTIPEDSWGISKLFANYVVDTTVTAISADATRITIRQHYATPTLKARLVNVLARPKGAKQTRDTLQAIKRSIENESARITPS